jgi:ankyrin repeat protein
MPVTTRSKRKLMMPILEGWLFESCGEIKDIDRARDLIENEGVSLDCVDAEGATPLLESVIWDHVDVGRLLLEKGANKEALCFYDGMPVSILQGAIIWDRFAFTRLLLEHGANVETLWKVKVGRNQYEYQSPLTWSILNGDYVAAPLLLRHGANPHQTICGDEMFSPLYLACHSENYALCSHLLMKYHVDVNAYAPRRNLPPVVGGVSSNVPTPAMSPLCMACTHNIKCLAKVLIKHSAKVVYNGGYYPDVPSPLKHAFDHASFYIIRLLLENLPHLEEDEAHILSPPLEAALKRGSPYYHVRMLVERGANVNDRPFLLQMARHGGSARTARELIFAGANVNQVDAGGGETPLWIAARNGHTELVEELLKSKANVGISDNNGETPLGVAYRFGHKGVFYLLLRSSPLVWPGLRKLLVNR